MECKAGIPGGIKQLLLVTSGRTKKTKKWHNSELFGA